MHAACAFVACRRARQTVACKRDLRVTLVSPPCALSAAEESERRTERAYARESGGLERPPSMCRARCGVAPRAGIARASARAEGRAAAWASFKPRTHRASSCCVRAAGSMLHAVLLDPVTSRTRATAYTRGAHRVSTDYTSTSRISSRTTWKSIGVPVRKPCRDRPSSERLGRRLP